MRRFWARSAVPKRRWRLKKVARVVVVAAIAIVGLQFLYPADRLLPNTHLGSQHLGALSQQEAKDKLAATYKDWFRTIQTADHEYTASPNDVGMQLDIDQTVAGPLGYHWWQRLLPGSFVWRIFNPHRSAAVNVQADSLKAFAEKLQQQNYKAPLNATIVFNNEQPSIQADQKGADYPVETVMANLRQDFFGGKPPLKLEQKVLDADVSEGNAQKALRDTSKFLEARPVYKLGGQSSELSKAELVAMFDFIAVDHQLALDFGVVKVQEFLAQLKPYMYDVPEGTLPQLDGQEVASIPGDDNQAINVTKAVTDFRESLKHVGQSQTVELVQIDLTPQLKAHRSYSKSQLGLRALVDDLVSKKGDYAIALHEIGGRGWSASSRGDIEFTPASTYKLFVAYSVLKNIEGGSWHWNDAIAGLSIEDCFDTMIINSDNACAEVFGERIGWKNIENQMYGLGLTHTSLTSSSGFISTANDELIFMTKLGRGEILNETSRNKLIDVMKRQVYRRGIPSGIDAPVADKVGFLFGLLHDAALVYAPQGTYALVILTDASTWGNIADTAERIQDHLD